MKSILNYVAKFLMRIFPNIPKFSLDKKLSEVINHKSFTECSSEQKDAILLNLAKKHYTDNESKPFDSYFRNFNLKSLFFQKTMLDLGCWCGGKAVSNAEKWSVAKMAGIDINEHFINAAKLFADSRKNQDIEYEFKLAYGELLPFEDESFDGIISYDVFEHVKSVRNTLSECKRILRPGGALFTVFPSYYTIGESHLDFATKFPIIHWLFPPKVLNKAYYEIISQRGDDAYWYRPSGNKEEWMKYDAGIGINGTTFNSFIKDAKLTGFTKIKIIPTPLFSVGKLAIKYPLIRILSFILMPVVIIPGLRDLFSHRIVAVLTR